MTRGRAHVDGEDVTTIKGEPTFFIPDLGFFSGKRSFATTYFSSRSRMLIFVLQVEPSGGEVVGEEIALSQ
ncbi:hypothetical protein TIFTF001_035152 [Ficus carica]|uniref:Uncharacterized protein n=1 Tax=Ficus carica TaxID=3494 RepID=A0AA88E2U4_FICCA|nr:hypothetical protein TIFTF001_035152 [Ficus carica]